MGLASSDNNDSRFSATNDGIVPLSGGGTSNYLRADGTWAAPAGGGGSGTVTSVAATNTQGVTTAVTNATTTPSIAVGLGAITPTSVAATGTVTGSNLSGTNTGDQNLAPYALIASPTFTGTPAAPTATAGTSTTQLATTKFVMDNDLLDAHLAGTETFTGAKTFSSTITGSISGNAATATALQTARTIAGQSFNGSANISIASTDLSDTTSIALLTATQTLTNKTLTAPVVTGGLASTVTSGTVAPVTATIDSSTATGNAILAKNNTNYAHTGSFVKVQALNATDTGELIKLENAGTGNYITADAVFAVAKSGAITSGGVAVPTTSSTSTLTNKRVSQRVLALSANSATPSINTDSYDVVHITGQSTAITSFSSGLSGTPVDGDKLRISITGTTAIAITWGSSFEASTVALPTTTVTTARLDVGFFWNSETSKWRCMAVA